MNRYLPFKISISAISTLLPTQKLFIHETEHAFGVLILFENTRDQEATKHRDREVTQVSPGSAQ